MPDDQPKRLELKVKRVVRTLDTAHFGDASTAACASGGNSAVPPVSCSRSRLIAEKLDEITRRHERQLVEEIQTALKQVEDALEARNPSEVKIPDNLEINHQLLVELQSG
jgi:hypothetical protein